jgi:hypothetical protein
MIRQKVVSQELSLGGGGGGGGSCFEQQCQKGQQGKTNTLNLKNDFLCFTHLTLFSQIKGQSKIIVIILKLVISVRDGHCDYLPQVRRKTSYVTGNNYSIMLLFRYNDQFL